LHTRSLELMNSASPMGWPAMRTGERLPMWFYLGEYSPYGAENSLSCQPLAYLLQIHALQRILLHIHTAHGARPSRFHKWLVIATMCSIRAASYLSHMFLLLETSMSLPTSQAADISVLVNQKQCPRLDNESRVSQSVYICYIHGCRFMASLINLVFS
jgi:hypothetical protein